MRRRTASRLTLACTLKRSPVQGSLFKSESLSLSAESFQESNRCHSRQPGCTWRSRGPAQEGVLCLHSRVSSPRRCFVPKRPSQFSSKKKVTLDHRDKQTMEGPRPNKNTASRLAAPYLLRSNGTFRHGTASLPFRAGNRPPESTQAYVTC